MSNHHSDVGSKKAKNIAAVLYLLVLAFLVGGSYINQHRADAVIETPVNAFNPDKP